jgi:pimeloyl-ACP methyl ester carboxylesterase
MSKKQNLKPFKRILLLHGWGARVSRLEPLANKLEELGWTVYTLPLPGFDLPAPSSPWTVNDYAKYALEKAERFFHGQKFFVFGHSFGGRIAIRIAYNRPDALSGIVLCAISGISRANRIKRLLFLFLAKLGKTFWFFPGLANFWKKMLYKLLQEHDYERAKGVMKETFKKVVEDDLQALIPSITTPTLILWGKADKMTPIKDAYFLYEALACRRLVVFSDQGHRLPYLKSQEVANEIDKWAKNFL